MDQTPEKLAELLAMFRLIAPIFKDVPDADVLAALRMASEYRPTCLSEARQDQAQVFYAAYLVYGIAIQNGLTPGAPGGITWGLIKSEKEGDLQRTYNFSGGIEGADPFGFFRRWSEFNDLCKKVGGGITIARTRGCCDCSHTGL